MTAKGEGVTRGWFIKVNMTNTPQNFQGGKLPDNYEVIDNYIR